MKSLDAELNCGQIHSMVFKVSSWILIQNANQFGGDRCRIPQDKKRPSSTGRSGKVLQSHRCILESSFNDVTVLGVKDFMGTVHKT